jgi:hypothetical protein
MAIPPGLLIITVAGGIAIASQGNCGRFAGCRGHHLVGRAGISLEGIAILLVTFPQITEEEKE